MFEYCYLHAQLMGRLVVRYCTVQTPSTVGESQLEQDWLNQVWMAERRLRERTPGFQKGQQVVHTNKKDY
jgi:hypothetical protein